MGNDQANTNERDNQQQIKHATAVEWHAEAVDEGTLEEACNLNKPNDDTGINQEQQKQGNRAGGNESFQAVFIFLEITQNSLVSNSSHKLKIFNAISKPSTSVLSSLKYEVLTAINSPN